VWNDVAGGCCVEYIVLETVWKHANTSVWVEYICSSNYESGGADKWCNSISRGYKHYGKRRKSSTSLNTCEGIIYPLFYVISKLFWNRHMRTFFLSFFSFVELLLKGLNNHVWSCLWVVTTCFSLCWRRSQFVHFSKLHVISKVFWHWV
jgi:hypothetical protein